MAGSQRRQRGIEPVAKAAGIAVLAVIFGSIALDVFGSLVQGRFGAAVSLRGIQYTVLNNLVTLVLVGGVLLVYDRGTDSGLVAKAAGALYATGLVQTLLFALLQSDFDIGVGFFLGPLDLVVSFLGYVVAFHVLFESDLVG